MKKESNNRYKIKSKKNFNKKASKYFNTLDGIYSALMYPGVIEKINMQSYSSILDVGCGTGVLLSLIAEQNKDISLNGIDFSEEMIKQATQLLDKKVNLICGDSDDLPWNDNNFDLIICTSSFHHYPEPYKVLNEMKRVLKPAGRLIIAEPCWIGIIRFLLNLYIKSPFNIEGDYRIYSKKEMLKICSECGFKVIDFDNPVGKHYIITAVIDTDNSEK